MATAITIKNIPEGYQSIITNGKHSIIGDEPVNSKGTDRGLSPSELVLAGLAMCKVGTVRYIARKNGWDVKDVTGKLVQLVKKEDSGLVPHITVEITIEGTISDEQKTELLNQADKCYIHRLLEGNWKIESSLPSTLQKAG